MKRITAILLISLILASGRLQAQHETAADIESGGRAYQLSCANCHGPDGDQITGIDLGRGQFRKTMTDAELVQIIRNGIPGTAMPPNTFFTEEQAAQVVAYLRSLATSKRSVATSGDPARGKMLFEGKGTCTTCHRVDGDGARLGPDLTTIGRLRRAIDLERSLLEPDAEILPANRSYRVVTKGGETITGKLLNLDTFTVQLLDSKERLRSFVKSNLREHGFVDKSPMPSFQTRLNQQELADVVSYLVSLKGRPNEPRAGP